MCFSETASFTAAALLAVQGLASLKLVQKQKSFLLLAAVPLLFAIQQFSEGLIWHHLNHQGLVLEGVSKFAAYLFLIFAFLVWPIFIPLSLLSAEVVEWKKKLLFLFVVGGIIWSLNLIFQMSHLNLIVTNHENSILYTADYFSDKAIAIMRVIYLGLLLIPIFISSLRFIWLFGFFTLLSAGWAYYFYAVTFTSVWCFFGAILSLMLYFVLKANLKNSYSKT